MLHSDLERKKGSTNYTNKFSGISWIDFLYPNRKFLLFALLLPVDDSRPDRLSWSAYAEETHRRFSARTAGYSRRSGAAFVLGKFQKPLRINHPVGQRTDGGQPAAGRARLFSVLDVVSNVGVRIQCGTGSAGESGIWKADHVSTSMGRLDSRGNRRLFNWQFGAAAAYPPGL